MIVCQFWSSRLTFFWRNMSISSIFYFSKSTSINTQYSSLWDTLKMMLFIKYLIFKWKCIGRISWKFQYWFNLKSTIELDIKRWMLYLSNAPLTLICLTLCSLFLLKQWDIHFFAKNLIDIHDHNLHMIKSKGSHSNSVSKDAFKWGQTSLVLLV